MATTTLFSSDLFVNIKEFDANKLTVSPVKINHSTKSKSIDIFYDGKQLVVRVPKMSVPLVWPSQDDNDGKVGIEMSFRDMESTPALKQFYDAIVQFDEKVLGEAVAASEQWFKKAMPIEALKFMFSPTVKASSDPKYAPTFKVKLFKDKKTNKLACSVYDENKNPIPNYDVAQLKGNNIMSLVQCTGIWIASPKFGTTWKLLQMRVFPRAKAVRAERVIDVNSVVQAATIDAALLTYSNVVTMPGGGKIIYINNNNGPFVFETPEMYCPYGASVWQDDHGSKFSLELCFKDADNNPLV
eukprot:gene19620-26304_t